MLTIMELKAREDGGHGLQSQSHRTECWLEGWVAVPEELAERVWNCGGYCEPVLGGGGRWAGSRDRGRGGGRRGLWRRSGCGPMWIFWRL